MQHNLAPYFESATLTSKFRWGIEPNFIAPNFATLDFEIAIIGIREDGNAPNNKGCAQSPDAIREKLYNFEFPFKNLRVSDLGNIKKGNGLNDSYAGLQFVVSQLCEARKIIILLGGSHDLTFPAFKGMSEHNNAINLTILDAYCDYKTDDAFDNRSFLSQFCNQPNLESVCVIGTQNFCTNVFPFKSNCSAIVDSLRLGELRTAFHKSEPFLRDSDFVTIDMGVVRYADNPASGNSLPTGLYAEELCQLTRYAGFSDRISMFGLFETNSTKDLHGISATLAAQAIWFFLDGLNSRYRDYPAKGLDKYKKIIVHQPDTDTDFIFYHNEENNRWWHLIQRLASEKVIACSYEDYLEVNKGNIPDRLMFG